MSVRWNTMTGVFLSEVKDPQMGDTSEVDRNLVTIDKESVWNWRRLCLGTFLILTEGLGGMLKTGLAQCIQGKHEVYQRSPQHRRHIERMNRPQPKRSRKPTIVWPKGRPLNRANGTWSMEVSACHHAPEFEKHRGNAQLRWITCENCGGRWEAPPREQQAQLEVQAQLSILNQMNLVRITSTDNEDFTMVDEGTAAGTSTSTSSAEMGDTPTTIPMTPTTPSPSTPQQSTHRQSVTIPNHIPLAMAKAAMENLNKISVEDMGQMETLYQTLKPGRTIQEVMNLIQQEARNSGNEPAVETVFQFCLVKAYQE